MEHSGPPFALPSPRPKRREQSLGAGRLSPRSVARGLPLLYAYFWDAAYEVEAYAVGLAEGKVGDAKHAAVAEAHDGRNTHERLPLANL